MTTRERVLAVLRGEKPDRIPWLGDLAYWIDYLNDEGLMPEQYLLPELFLKEDAKKINSGYDGTFNETGLQKLHLDLGVGFYLQGYFPFTTTYGGDIKITEEKTHKGKDILRVTTVSTPYGNLYEEWEYVFSTHSWGPKKRMVRDVGDLKKIRYLYENTHYEPDYALATRRYNTIGDKGVVLCYIPKCPIMEMIALRAGIETVVNIICDDEDEWRDHRLIALHVWKS